jgi:[histone H3]-lysine36 N-dimethyltransferase SETMAR
MSCLPEKIDLPREYLHAIALHEFRLKNSARAAAKNINQSMGQGTITHVTVSNWFNRFREGNLKLDDEERSGRPPVVNLDELRQLIEEDPRQTTRCLAEQFECCKSTIENALHALGKSWRYGLWIPHELTPHLKQLRADICDSLLLASSSEDWLRHVVTGDEKWVVYVNHSRKRQWLGPGETGVPTPKTDRFEKKVMIACWWNFNGILHWDILPPGTTMNSAVYCEQLDIVARKLRGKQRKVLLLHDNARPHVSSMTRQKVKELGWDVVPHPPYSPDLAPTDYHLFRSLSAHLEGKKFDDEEDLRNELQSFFDQKPQEFYKHGIFTLRERYQKVVDSNGDYV